MSTGDMVSTLSLDDYEYVTGLRSASAETKKFAHEAGESHNELLHKTHRAQHKAIHLLAAASFAANAGEGDKSMVGQLEKATMIAPMIGMAFGPVGTAVGAVAGIIGAGIVGSLKEAKERALEFGKAMEEGAKKWDAYTGKIGESKGFERRLSDIAADTDPKTILAEKKKAEGEREDAEAQLAARREQQAKQMRAYEKNRIGQMDDPTEKAEASRDFMSRSAGKTDAQYLRSSANLKIGAEDPAAQKAIMDTKEKMEELEDVIRRAENRTEALGEKLEDANAFAQAKEDAEKLLALEKEREALAEKIGKEVQTPYEGAKEKLDELLKAYERGIIDEDTFQRANKKALDDADKQEKALHPESPKNAAVAGRGAGAYAAIRESIRASQKGASPELSELRRQTKLHEEQLAEMRKHPPPSPSDDAELHIP